MALVLTIFLMLLCSLTAVTAASLLIQGTIGAQQGYAQSVETFAIALGGKDWYLQQLAGETDWTNETNQTGIALGSGTFDIAINNANARTVAFTVTGKRSGYYNRTVQRQASVTARQLPKAFNFAVYWGRDTGAWLQIRNSSTINGDLWSRGTTEVLSGNSVTGISYRPDNEDITGAGIFTEAAVNSPYPTMPQIDETPYNNLMNSFDNYIDTYSTGSDLTQSTNLVLTGNVVGCRNLDTTGNITISGYGYIVAGRNIDLHATSGASGTLTITPSGGNIYILAGRSLTVNSTSNDTNVTINNGTYLYSRAQSNTNQLVELQKHSSTTTSVDGAVIIARRRIIVKDGSQVTNSTLYVSDVSDANNYLRIQDNGTSVTGSSIISVSGRDPGLIINNDASVSGLIYHWGENSGYTQINSATITGSVVASQYTNDRIVSSTITYDNSSLPSSLPAGFEGFASVTPGSWDDN